MLGGESSAGRGCSCVCSVLLTGLRNHGGLIVGVPLCFPVFRAGTGALRSDSVLPLSFWLVACPVYFRVFVFFFKFLIDLIPFNPFLFPLSQLLKTNFSVRLGVELLSLRF